MAVITKNNRAKDVAGHALGPQLFAAWEQQDVRYVVWKGGRHVADGMQGRDDLDILVGQSDYRVAVSTLEGHGFVRTRPSKGMDGVSVAHYYGFDESLQRFIHVHLYQRLFTGESVVHTHHLPLEDLLLGDRRRIRGVWVASAASELAVSVLRAMIKLGSVYEWAWFGGSPERFEEKLKPLLEEVDGAAAYERLASHIDVIDRRLFLECLEVLSIPASPATRFAIGWRVRRRLSEFARHSAAGTANQYLVAAARKIGRLATVGQSQKRLERGLVAAVVGADATGKSTLLADLKDWSSAAFATRSIHVGKPPATLLTWWATSLLPAARILFPRQRHGQQRVASDEPRRQQATVLQAVRAIALAWDRRRLIRRAHRWAAAGEIVLCDRYISTTPGAMDSPRLQPAHASRQPRWLRWMARWEQSIYRDNPPPDVVIKLTVPIEVARQRNQQRAKADKHTDAELLLRHRGFHRWQSPARAGTFEVDTQQDLEQTKTAVRKRVWGAISELAAGRGGGCG